MRSALSLIFWALIIVVSVEYLLFVLKADNHGEGGIIALVALFESVAFRVRLATPCSHALGSIRRSAQIVIQQVSRAKRRLRVKNKQVQLDNSAEELWFQ
jgi:hypothetical protein